MPTPTEVFENPRSFLNYLTVDSDDKFEGQHFDRKEAGRLSSPGQLSSAQMNNLKSHLKETISAFANTNKDGGLLVLGVSGAGEIRGINHLSDDQRKSLTDFNCMLTHQAAQVKELDCENINGEADKIYLIYAPYSSHGICETLEHPPKFWVRDSAQNIPGSPSRREQLQHDKRIVDFEGSFCCPYDPNDLDQDVLKEFRRSYTQDSNYAISDEQLLYQAGALVKSGSGYAYTKAGFLFFAANPQRVLSWAYIRLLRFEGIAENRGSRGLPTFERQFGGSIIKQIHSIRAFFPQSAFFKTYSRRDPAGGFVDEPEYPYIAVDEAIVNAVAHRNYAVQLPIECEAYKNAFSVRNAGRVEQREHDMPDHFTLKETILESSPRNPKIIEWLRLMRDERDNRPFVRALSEGTKVMRDTMSDLKLPAPIYQTSHAQTTLTLLNNVTQREALLHLAAAEQPDQYVNLFPMNFIGEKGQELDGRYIEQRRKDLTSALRDSLRANGWFIHKFSHGRIIAHRKGAEINLPNKVASIVRFFPAYSFQLRHYWGRYYLCIDYSLEVKSRRSVSSLLRVFSANDLVGKTALAKLDRWQQGRIVAVDEEWTRVHFFDFDQEETVASRQVIPNLSLTIIDDLLQREQIKFDLFRTVRQHSLSLQANAARTRAERTVASAADIASTIFPLRVNGLTASLGPTPEPLTRMSDGRGLQVKTLQEPTVEFSHHHAVADIRDGITKFGAYDDTPKTIELVPICTPQWRTSMADLIERLKSGKYKYRGSERTFHTRFAYNSIVTVQSTEQALNECIRLLREHPEWVGDDQFRRLFLIHTPERGYSSDDETSPYYQIKRYLLEHGIPCQMVDTPTLENPDWKDLNLALNITAKCGVTPWVLPNAIPDADFFVGLSYTQSGRRNSERLMGYANVFTSYGKWEFYSGNTEAFPYEDRTRHYESLIRHTLERLSLPETPSIHFHYSAKFSHEDCAAILAAARSVRPQGTYSFVWINTHHKVRFYDARTETDGSLSRGSYVIGSPNQVYLSTTGYNPYRQVLGTPQMLEINVRVHQPSGYPVAEPDLQALAIQILSLTKLNLASTDSLCAEPITTKYAGDIAYLTSAFLRQNPSFRLHPALEKTPWFI